MVRISFFVREKVSIRDSVINLLIKRRHVSLAVENK